MSKWLAFPKIPHPKIWVDINDDFANALNLYQPASTIGRVIKCLVRISPDFLSRVFFSGRPDITQESHLEVLAEEISKVLKIDSAVISFSTGTPGPHMKMTAQVSQHGQIQAYVKIGQGEEVVDLLSREENALRKLVKSGIDTIRVPRVLHSVEIDNYYALFLSAPDKPGKQSPLIPDVKDVQFLKELGTATMRKLPVDAVLERMGLSKLISRLSLADPSAANMFQHAADYIKSSLEDGNVKVSSCHGDYAPWNTLRLSNGELYVFDWEYFDEAAPCLVDMFNRELMIARLVKKNKESIAVQRLLGLWEDPILKSVVRSMKIPREQAYTYVIMYLLYMVVRESGIDGIPSLYMKECMHKALVSANFPGHHRRVLVSAYACEPDQGSEPGVGWHWVEQISRENDVWVITRKNNQKHIEHEMQVNPRPNLHFEYVDLPRWLRFWKRGRSGVRTYYYFWQFAALFRSLNLHRRVKFDIGHHVTFVNDWLWSFMACLPIPFVWGPIGSNAPCPSVLLVHRKDRILDNIRIFVQRTVRMLDPLYWLTVIRSGVVLVINEKIGQQFPLSWLARDRCEVEPAIGIDVLDNQCNVRPTKLFTVLYVGRFQYVKCPHLAIESFAQFSEIQSNSKLLMVGTGPKEHYLKTLVKDLAISDKVNFIEWTTREKILELMCNASAFLFPSAEGAGMVVLEAMACGLPVISLDFGGPGELVGEESGLCIPIGEHREMVKGLAMALQSLHDDAELRENIAAKAKARVESNYLWDCKSKRIGDTYQSLVQKL